MTKLPSKIKVGHLVFKVEEKRGLENNEGNKLKGQCDCTKQKIYINPEHHHSFNDTADTLVHEILHAIFWHYNIKSNSTEEDIVKSCSSGLITVLNDNPELRRYLNNVGKS